MDDKPPYHVDKKLKRLWEKNSLEVMKKKNSDRVHIVDGREGSGKSYWTIQQACYIEPSLLESPEKLVSRICFSPEEFREIIRETKNGVIIFDEAFRGFSSRAAMSRINKILVQTLMEMRQNNNIVFIVLPSFFLLDIYPAMLRSDILFNIYEDKKNNKRAFRGYNRKDKNSIYQIGLKRGWTYPFDSHFKGRFYNKFPGGETFLDAYIKKKADALQRMFPQDFIQDDVVKIAVRLRNVEKKQWKEIGEIVGMTADAIARRVQRQTNMSIYMPPIFQENNNKASG